MTDNPMKRIAEEIEASKPAKKSTRANHTLSFDQANFIRLQAYCREHGVKVSSVLDKLIATFLESRDESSP